VIPGYPTPMLPEGDPWAPAVNRAVADVEADAEADYDAPASYAEWLAESQQELEAEL
jgi:hypothetical protein